MNTLEIVVIAALIAYFLCIAVLTIGAINFSIAKNGIKAMASQKPIDSIKLLRKMEKAYTAKIEELEKAQAEIEKLRKLLKDNNVQIN